MSAASVRAGTPTVVAPYYGDQPYWAARLAGRIRADAGVATATGHQLAYLHGS